MSQYTPNLDDPREVDRRRRVVLAAKLAKARSGGLIELTPAELRRLLPDRTPRRPPPC